MSSDPNDKIMNAEAWSEFCDLLKKAGDVLLREDLDTDLFDRAEGHRYLARLLRAGLSSFVENPGPLHPIFRAMPDMVKMGLDNPDNYYVSASVNPSLEYRIRGSRGTNRSGGFPSIPAAPAAAPGSGTSEAPDSSSGRSEAFPRRRSSDRSPPTPRRRM